MREGAGPVAVRPRRGARAGRSRLGRWAALLLLLVTVGAAAPSGARADGVAALSALEAAYTFHFLNLIRWERPAPRLELCVLGESPTGERLRRSLQDKTVHGQSVHVRSVAREGGDDGRCDALYIPAAHASSAPALLKRYENSATLTISDIPGFVQDGGVIGFVVVEDRLRFDINERAAARRGLRISAKLLELARRIVR